VKYSQLKNNIQQQNDSLINAIKSENLNRIQQLETEKKIKDDKIIELNS
jgi:hypothetical protein